MCLTFSLSGIAKSPSRDRHARTDKYAGSVFVSRSSNWTLSGQMYMSGQAPRGLGHVPERDWAACIFVLCTSLTLGVSAPFHKATNSESQGKWRREERKEKKKKE